MRFALLLALLVFGGLFPVRAQTVALEAVPSRKHYREGSNNEITVEARITVPGPATTPAIPVTPADSVAVLPKAPPVASALASAGRGGRGGGAGAPPAGIPPAAPPARARGLADNPLVPASGAASATVAVPPVRNVVLVLDRSGSMAGPRIEALRRAAQLALDSLAPTDYVAVVAFGSEIETVIETQRRDRLADPAKALAAIEPVGGAALYDALNQAAAQLRRNRDAAPAALDQIILITDGPPTKGPREPADFALLAEAFAREGISFTALGLGPDFEEDTLAAMARTAYGHFRYLPRPDALAPALSAEILPAATVVGTDAVLTIEFHNQTRKARSFGWRAPVVAGQKLTWTFPRLYAGQSLSFLASAELDAFYTRFDLERFAVVRLQWKNAADGAPRELVQALTASFARDLTTVRDRIEVGVARSAAVVAIREGLQHAIEELDKGDKADPRRALRLLRTARTDARDLNYGLEDPQIDAFIRRYDGHLAQWATNPPTLADRKFLRSGLLGEVDPPAVIMEPKN